MSLAVVQRGQQYWYLVENQRRYGSHSLLLVAATMPAKGPVFDWTTADLPHRALVNRSKRIQSWRLSRLLDQGLGPDLVTIVVPC